MPSKIRALAISICLFGSINSPAAPVSLAQARQACANWLLTDNTPFDLNIGVEILSVEKLADLGYVIYLKPNGMVIMPGDNRIEPVLAFSAKGVWSHNTNHPLTTLVGADLKARMRWLENTSSCPPGNCANAVMMWQALQSPPALGAHLTKTSDLRVPPLLQSTWDQKKTDGELCYNYYTPNHYPCGCVATAMAQLMRYYRHPVTAVGPRQFEVVVENDPHPYQTLTIKGGDGYGGAYNWDSMPYSPCANTPQSQRQAIGALCFDAGIAVNMRYGPIGSSADMVACMQALGNVFLFANVIYGWNNFNYIGSGLIGMLIPNLDAGLPCLLSVSGSGGAHAILCDGYGYHNGIMYHHLNMGWGEDNSADNTWYALPNIDATLEFDCLNACLYNIFPGGTGEIISGRICDAFGNPITGARITATHAGGGQAQVWSNRRGIYALPCLPSSSTYNLTVAKPGYTFRTRSVNTGLSRNYAAAAGNCAGIDFIGNGPASEPVVYPLMGDWIGNGKAELALYADDTGTWQIRITGQTSNLVYGIEGCQPVLADFDGDGKADPGLYHDELGLWCLRLTAHKNAMVVFAFGCSGSHPVAGDFDDDGKADPGLYQASTTRWYVLLSGQGYAATTFNMGGGVCRPLTGLFDHDHKADPALFEYTSGTWIVYLSTCGYQPIVFTYGAPGDWPVAGDFDGDSLADPALYCYASGIWRILLSGRRYAPVEISFF